MEIFKFHQFFEAQLEEKSIIQDIFYWRPAYDCKVINILIFLFCYEF